LRQTELPARQQHPIPSGAHEQTSGPLQPSGSTARQNRRLPYRAKAACRRQLRDDPTISAKLTEKIDFAADCRKMRRPGGEYGGIALQAAYRVNPRLIAPECVHHTGALQNLGFLNECREPNETDVRTLTCLLKAVALNSTESNDQPTLGGAVRC
jgi:hypothetical protein